MKILQKLTSILVLTIITFHGYLTKILTKFFILWVIYSPHKESSKQVSKKFFEDLTKLLKLNEKL